MDLVCRGGREGGIFLLARMRFVSIRKERRTSPLGRGQRVDGLLWITNTSEIPEK